MIDCLYKLINVSAIEEENKTFPPFIYITIKFEQRKTKIILLSFFLFLISYILSN